MKKNKTLRAASCLAIAALASTCLVAGTFAKYTASGISQNIARTAAFGVEMTPSSSLFAKSYTSPDGASVTVQSQADDNVIAPGTSGSAASVKLSGTPEVKVAVTNTADVTFDGQWIDQLKHQYIPLVVTIGDTVIDGCEVVEGTNYNGETEYNRKYSLLTFTQAVKDAVEKTSGTYDAGSTDLSQIADATPTISWSWPFERSVPTRPDHYISYDSYDSILAYHNDKFFTLSVTTTVTQVD